MNLSVQQDNCWLCGTDKELTCHHVIPQTFHPRNNMTIPLCKTCHKRINSGDYGLLTQELYKSFKRIEDITKSLKNIDKGLNQVTIKDIIK